AKLRLERISRFRKNVVRIEIGCLQRQLGTLAPVVCDGEVARHRPARNFSGGIRKRKARLIDIDFAVQRKPPVGRDIDRYARLPGPGLEPGKARAADKDAAGKAVLAPIVLQVSGEIEP